MNFRKLILWIILGVGIYYGLEYYRVQSSGDVVAYKRFAQALMHGRTGRAALTSNSELLEQLSQSQKQRNAYYRGKVVVFTYFVVRARSLTDGGRTALISGEQVTRVNPSGAVTLWGKEEVRIPQSVRLEYRNQLWKVTQFEDPAARSVGRAK